MTGSLYIMTLSLIIWNMTYLLKNSDEVTHYVAFFKTLNGFEKYYVMSKEEVEKHGKAYSKAYNSSHSPWKSDFDTMAQKTVLKQLISKFGILSIEMQLAQKADQTVIKDVNKDNIDVEYVDNPKKQNESINIEPLEDDFDSSELFAGYANNKEGKMREYKYRAWYKELKKIIVVQHIDFILETVVFVDTDNMDLAVANSKDIELMQFTGHTMIIKRKYT